jgi:hypothetical protein
MLLPLLLLLLAEPAKLCSQEAWGVGGCKSAAACDAQGPLQLLCTDASCCEVRCDLLLEGCPVLLLLLDLQGIVTHESN